MGNRTSKTDTGGGINGTVGYSYNNANMLLTRGANSYTNDADGNTLTGGGRTNTWDSENRLISCSYSGNTTTNIYGSDGIRHRSTVNGTTTDTVLDSLMMVREMRGGSAYATYFIGAHGPEYRRDNGTPTSAVVRWYVYDGLGSVIAEVDPSGNVTSSRKYDAYGLVRGGVSPGGTSKQKFVGSLGHTSDDESGLIYMRARYLDPTSGRFANEDAAKDGPNWFVYTGNNLVNKVDASGNEVIGAIVGAIIRMILGGISAYYFSPTQSVLLGMLAGAISGAIGGLIGNPAVAGFVGSFIGSVTADLNAGGFAAIS